MPILPRLYFYFVDVGRQPFASGISFDSVLSNRIYLFIYLNKSLQQANSAQNIEIK